MKKKREGDEEYINKIVRLARRGKKINKKNKRKRKCKNHYLSLATAPKTWYGFYVLVLKPFLFASVQG